METNNITPSDNLANHSLPPTILAPAYTNDQETTSQPREKRELSNEKPILDGNPNDPNNKTLLNPASQQGSGLPANKNPFAILNPSPRGATAKPNPFQKIAEAKKQVQTVEPVAP